MGKRVVVVMDEAQNLGPAVLELIRMLSNFETPQQKLLQIILAG
jgi:general secretion pathway protein A